MNAPLPPETAWQPLPPEEWSAEAARHLLRRAGWTAIPGDASAAARDGLPATLDRLFPSDPVRFEKPALTAEVEEEWPPRQRRLPAASPEERRSIQRELRERSQSALLDMSIRWLQYAAKPENSAFAKWVLFLSDVYVVAFAKVPRTPLLYRHFDLLAGNALGPAPVLTKAVSRSPAMVAYLDLVQNRPGAPNENFARELFELFVLGEGNYSERDIKEAARAFTGYRVRPPGAEFVFVERQHDPGVKTVFGRRGRFSGDDIIDLAYEQPAAAAFLPHELVKFYLSDTGLPPDHLRALGNLWKADGFSLRSLARLFFGSRIFFAPEFRGDFIKSPIQFYLGLVQDLGLGVTPVPRFVLNPLRQMGQVLFNPPNVRGWVGGRNWINSSSLFARRTQIETVFFPIPRARLNAEEVKDLEAAGDGRFAVGDADLERFSRLGPEEAATQLTRSFLSVGAPPAFMNILSGYLAGAGAVDTERLRRTRRAAITVLASPEYQLC